MLMLKLLSDFRKQIILYKTEYLIILMQPIG